jgi:hypothetical protein
VLVAGQPGDRFTLEVQFHGGQRALPIVNLREGGEEIGTFRQGNGIRREEEGGWILVYASDDERRRLREARYKFD